MNRARRKIPVGVRYRKGAVENVAGNHAVVEVHNSRGGIDVQDDALHRPDEVIARAKIRSERYDGIGHGRSPFETPLAKHRARAPYINPYATSRRIKCMCSVPEWLPVAWASA